MLSIPFKKTDASIDLAGPLRRYLIKEFSKEEVQKFSDDLQQLQRLRATATQVERPSEEARGSLLRYTLQLEALEPVFPVSETEVRVGFKWGDAFNPNKKSTQSTLLFERACVLYNLGSHESRSASQEDRSTEAGLKEACHRFQVTAGIYQFIRERVVGGLVGTLTQDLIPDGLSAASTLMLAQAQACFYEKAVKDRAKTALKSSIIAKLAAKAGEFYTQALSYMQGPNLAPGLDKSWPAHVEFQSISFAAAGYYWESISTHEVADETGSGYGLEIAQLQKTSEMLEQAFRLAHRNGLSSMFTTSADTLNVNVTKTLASRKKDNTSIYMEPVVSMASLKPVKGACMVKAIPFGEATPGEAGSIGRHASLFDGLLSKSAKAALEEYKRKEEQAIAALDATCKDRSSHARGQLAAVGLPGTVEAHESVGGVPESVWTKVQTVKQGGGGLAELKEKITEVEGLAERARATLETVERTLDQDQRQDESFRKRYAGEYEGLSTAELAVDLRRDVGHYRELWKTGKQADTKVMGRIDMPEDREGLELLELTREGLDAAMPAGKGAGAEENGGGVKTEKLSAKLVELAALLADRDTKMSALTEFVKNRNVAPELAKVSRSSGGGPEAYHGAVEVALQDLQPFRVEIETNLEIQGALLDEILAENQRFQQARASDSETLEREKFLQRIHSSVMLFHEIHAQLTEGSMFYSDLLKRLAQLNQTCEDLVYTQGLHRREFEVSYTHRREKALKEGEDASIELARQMEAQAQVAPGSQNTPVAPQGGAVGITTKSAGYPTRGAYGQVPWPAFTPAQAPGNPSQPPPPQQHYQPPQQLYQQPGQQPYQPPPQPYQPQHQQPYQQQHSHPQPQQQPYGYAPPPAAVAGQNASPYKPAAAAGQNTSPYKPAGAYSTYGAPHQPQPQPNIPGGGVYYGQGGAGNPAAHVPPTQGPPAYSAVVPAATHGSHRTAPPPAAPAPAPSTARWGPWLSSHSPQAPPAPAEPPAAQPHDPKLSRLLEMGFDPAKTRAALAEAKGNEDAAISKLLSEG